MTNLWIEPNICFFPIGGNTFSTIEGNKYVVGGNKFGKTWYFNHLTQKFMEGPTLRLTSVEFYLFVLFGF